ncbi:hypothetical protein U9M48_014116 [Paspalum notatum var. saurae]|uniref:Uncharacterized protein n=1 Tax=Paspalum notatum var. saurae TaxID=547442 RepID=A0AAQ3T3K7_PASNO
MRATTRFSGGDLRWWTLATLFLCARLWSSSSPSLTAAADERVVTHLPGFQGRLPFQLRTGYVEVDESNGVRLFYYFTASEGSPADDPLMLWLSGGPGCTSFTGLVYQIGPLSFDLGGYTGGLPKLVYRLESWTKVSNIIFLDSPVGTGFSYSVREQGYNSSDTRAVNQIVIFLKKWFDEHPEFLSNPLYIGGDSYSGIIVPTVTSEIAKGNEVGSEPYLNLKGYLVGNPFADFSGFDEPSKIPFAHRMALISDQIYECVKDIFPFHILEPLCAYASPHEYSFLKLKMDSGIQKMQHLQDYTGERLSLSEISTECRTMLYTLSRLWANNVTVREALGIHKETVPLWLRCNNNIQYLKDIQSSVKYHLDVTTKGYRSLVYSGDHDMAVPYIGTQSWIRSLNFSIVDDWRPWYADGQVAGYTTSYSNNLTFATVKGAGHTAPEYNPRQCLAMLSRWLAVEQPDSIKWNLSKHGLFTMNSMYGYLVNQLALSLNKYLWRLKLLLKMKIFIWFLFKSVLLTKDNLVKNIGVEILDSSDESLSEGGSACVPSRVLAQSALLDAREDELRRGLIVTSVGDRGEVPARAITSLLAQRFDIAGDLLLFWRLSAVESLLMLPDEATALRVFDGGQPVITPSFRLHLARWTRFFHAAGADLS